MPRTMHSKYKQQKFSTDECSPEDHCAHAYSTTELHRNCVPASPDD